MRLLPSFGGSVGPLCGLLPLAVFLAFLPSRASAQEEFTVTELESLYLAAKGERESAVQHWGVLKSQYDRAAQEFDLAQAAGDTERRDRAFTQTQILAPQLRSQQRRVEELQESLRVARRRYIEALEVQLDSLLVERAQARNPQDSVNLAIAYTDTNNRYQDLLREEEDPALTLEAASGVTRDPRDSPQDLRRKAAQEDYKADKYGSLRDEYDLRLGELREAQRRDRIARDFMTGLDRFDDIRPPGVATSTPTGPPRDPTQVPPGADSLGVDRPLTLEERIQLLQVQRELVEEAIQQARSNARQYREWAGGGGR